MANPIALAAGGVGMAATMEGGRLARQGAGIQAAGARYQGEAQAAMYTYQAGIAQANAELAEREKAYAIEKGEVDAQEIGLKGRAQMAETVTAITAGNISRFSPSAQAVLSSEQSIIQFGEATERYSAVRLAYGRDVAAAMDIAQAGAYRSAAATAPIAAEYQARAAEIGGQASYLGAVASTASQFARLSQVMLPGLPTLGG